MNTNTMYPEHMAAAMAAALAAKGSTMMAPETTAAEIRRYMDKLKDLVPQCPKNKKVTKLELIQHVIDYISDLQDTLQSDSDSDSPPESPMDHVSFSDVYSSSPPMFQPYDSHSGPSHHHQHQHSTQQPSDFSMNYSNDTSNVAGGGFNSFNKVDLRTPSSYSSNNSSSSGSGSSNNYSTILYSDPGSTNTGHGFGLSS